MDVYQQFIQLLEINKRDVNMAKGIAKNLTIERETPRYRGFFDASKLS